MTLNILMVTSEAYPLAKTGGLGDATSGLAQAVNSENTPVTVMVPAWRGTLEKLHDVRQVAQLADLPGGPATLLAGDSKELGVPVLLLQNGALYDREGLYVDPDGEEYADNAVRFAALSMAAAHVARGVGVWPRPAVVHVHDWHTALTPLFMDQLGVTDVKSMLTLHNVAFQGVYPMDIAPVLGIHERYCQPDGMEFWGKLNFLKAGIRFADLVTVVSNNYAREILTPRFGCGLEGALAERGKDLVAIPNGIDTKIWDPSHDIYLRGTSYSVDQLGNKSRCKRKLQAAYGLQEASGTFLLAMGSRLTHQKMADVAAEALPMALEKHPGLQICIMGKGDKTAEAALVQLAQRYPGRCGVHIGYTEPRAHLLHAGADALLHGSRFEPFGLTPLYAMRYGTVPVGSRVGGMVDTIVDPGDDAAAPAMRKATGILFDGDRPEDMLHAIDRAVTLKQYPVLWRNLQRNGMMADMGWERVAPIYVSSYQSLRPDVALGRVPERASTEPKVDASVRQARMLAAAALRHPPEPVRFPVRALASTAPVAAGAASGVSVA